MQENNSPAPVSQSKRIVDLDILRGFALFGILVVNLMLFAHPMYSLVADKGMFGEWYNQAADFFIRLFFEGKFITLFSFLFGIGFYIFAERLKEKGRSFYPVYTRRMALLFLFGYLHALLLWSGDILAPYAIGGILLMLFFNRRDKTIRVWIALLLGGLAIGFSLLILFIAWASTIPEAAEGMIREFENVAAEFHAMLLKGYQVHETGSFRAIMDYRGEERGFVWIGMFMSPAGLLYVLAIFLFGLCIGRKGILDNPQVFRDYFIGTRKRNLTIGLIFSLLYTISHMYIDPVFYNEWYLVYIIAFLIGTPLLCFGFIGLLLNALQNAGENSSLKMFAPVGRMALTNYLMQSIICTTIFSGYALGFFGKLSPVMVLPLAAAVFALQVWYSRWYMNRFSMGPAERLWRMGTYLKRV